MRQFKLDKRLQTCADFITHGAKIADIGTDHAYLPIWLVLNGKITSAIASDSNILPLKRAEENLKKYNAEEKIRLLKTDGLNGISPTQVDEIVIAGMGGELISNILSSASWIKDEKKRLILQPASSESDLRIFLRDNNFSIEKERAVRSLGRIYIVISAVHMDCIENSTIEYPYMGKLYKNLDKETIEYLNRQIRDLENQNKGHLLRKNKKKYFSNLCIIEKIKELIDGFGGDNFELQG